MAYGERGLSRLDQAISLGRLECRGLAPAGDMLRRSRSCMWLWLASPMAMFWLVWAPEAIFADGSCDLGSHG